jgi:hypothetical protein
VLAAADAATGACAFTHQFRNQSADIFGEGEIVPMAAVVAENEISGQQLPRKSHRRELLAYGGVDGAIEITLGKKFQELLLDPSDEQGFLNGLVVKHALFYH